MAITDHVAILASHALAAAVPNKKKAGNPLQFYGLLAFPPAAFNDLNAALTECAGRNNVALNPSMSMGVKPNAHSPKPLAGVPGDWFVIRASSGFAPEIYTAQNVLLAQAQPEQQQLIRSSFFAGKKVRAMVTPWFWRNQDGTCGFSWNLNALMDAGEGGERIPGSRPDTGAAFKQYAKPPEATAPASGFGGAQHATGNPFGGAPQGVANPQQATANFGGAQPVHQANPGVNPQQSALAFGGGQAAPSANPFAQASGNGSPNPFTARAQG